MRAIRKITSEVFDDAKRQLQTLTRAQVAQKLGLSTSTIGYIDNSQDYADYLEHLNISSERLYQKVREAGLTQLSGEPLFWRVHSDLRRVPNSLIATELGTDISYVRLMKECLDYETFKREVPKSYEEVAVRKQVINEETYGEIKNFLADGHKDKDILELFHIDLITLTSIRESRDYKEFCGGTTNKTTSQITRIKCSHKKTLVNEGIYEVIKLGLAVGVAPREIAKELEFKSVQTILNVRNSNDYDDFCRKLHRKKDYLATRASYTGTKDFLTWSVAQYGARGAKAPWLTSENREKLQEIISSTPKLVISNKINNAWAFRMIQRGLANGYGSDVMAESFNVPIDEIEKVLRYPLFKDLAKDTLPVYDPVLDADLFNDVLQVVRGEMSTKELFSKHVVDSRIVSDMSRYKNFAKYLIHVFFRDVEPAWLYQKAGAPETLTQASDGTIVDLDQDPTLELDMPEPEEVPELKSELETISEPTGLPPKTSPEGDRFDRCIKVWGKILETILVGLLAYAVFRAFA